MLCLKAEFQCNLRTDQSVLRASRSAEDVGLRLLLIDEYTTCRGNRGEL